MFGHRLVGSNSVVEDGNYEKLVTSDNQDKALKKNSIWKRFFLGFEFAIIGTIFGLLSKKTTAKFLEETGRFFLFPSAALNTWVNMAMAWRQVVLEKWKVKNSVLEATLESAVAVAVTLAVALGFTVSALTSQLIFTGALGVKMFYNLGAVLVHAFSKEQPKDKILGHTAGFLATGLAAAAVITVMMLEEAYLAPLGVAAAAIGVGSAVFHIVRAICCSSNASNNLTVHINPMNLNGNGWSYDVHPQPSPKNGVDFIAYYGAVNSSDNTPQLSAASSGRQSPVDNGTEDFFAVPQQQINRATQGSTTTSRLLGGVFVVQECGETEENNAADTLSISVPSSQCSPEADSGTLNQDMYVSSTPSPRG